MRDFDEARLSGVNADSLPEKAWGGFLTMQVNPPLQEGLKEEKGGCLHLQGQACKGSSQFLQGQQPVFKIHRTRPISLQTPSCV